MPRSRLSSSPRFDALQREFTPRMLEVVLPHVVRRRTTLTSHPGFRAVQDHLTTDTETAVGAPS